MPRQAKLQEKKSDATRARIKEAMIALVGRKPATHITINDICTAAKITHGGFYFHFKNKDQALIEIAAGWLRDFKTAVLDVPRNEDFMAEIHGMIDTYIEGYIRNIELTKAVYRMDPLRTGIRSVYNQYHDRWLARLEERFKASRQEAGREIGGEVTLAHGLTAALEGLCVRTYLLGAAELSHFVQDPAALAREVAVFWFRAVMGTDPPPPGRGG